jgi:hypothetical protein
MGRIDRVNRVRGKWKSVSNIQPDVNLVEEVAVDIQEAGEGILDRNQGADDVRLSQDVRSSDTGARSNSERWPWQCSKTQCPYSAGEATNPPATAIVIIKQSLPPSEMDGPLMRRLADKS